MSRFSAILRWVCAILGVAIIAVGFTLSPRGSQGRWLACLALGSLLIAVKVWPRFPEDDPEDESRPLINIVAAVALIFAIVALQMAKVQAFFSGDIASRTGIDPVSGDVFSNPRSINADLVTHRGQIVDRNGTVLARSIKRKSIYVRQYPEADVSYVVGYNSAVKYGQTGLEASFDDELSGRGVDNPVTEQFDELLGREPQGANLELTIDAELQTQAHQLMEDRIGAAIVIDIRTGAVRVLASNPHFDPEELVAVNSATSQSATDYWATLNADPSRPLLVRAVDGLYTPGSTFKTVTLSAALAEGIAKPSDIYVDDGQLDVDGHIINEENRPDDTVSQWTLKDGLAYSLNVVFAQVGLQLGASRLREYAERFGFGQDIPFDEPVATGQVSFAADFLNSDAGVADTAFGQGQLLTSPLGMALVVSGIANDGVIMRPYLVERIVKTNGDRIRTTKPVEWRRPIDTETAATVRELMVYTVTNGYAGGAAVDGYIVGGKTGTAESGIGDPEPKYGIAVVLEYGGEGIAGPIQIARELLASTIAADS
jgi:peptidoglycan glycosyltransferase